MTYILFFVYLLITYNIGEWFGGLAGDTFLYAVATLPGTFLHECMHYAAALMLNGSPQNFSIIPSGDTLGSVMFAGNWYNRATVAMAPLLLAPFTFWFVAAACRKTNPLTIIGLLYVAACSWVACIPSPQDFSIAFRGPASWPFAVIILSVVSLVTIKIVYRTLNRV